MTRLHPALRAAAEPGYMRRAALRGGFWVSASQLIRIGIQLASVIVLARLLRAEDFGLVAAVAPVVAFVALFQDLGFQQAIVQRDALDDRDLNAIFWSAALFGGIWTLLLCALGPAVGWFYGDDRLTALTLASNPPVLLGSLACVPLGLLARRMQFGLLAITEVAAALVGVGVAVALAALGWSYWALVVAVVAAAAVGLVLAWSVCGWRPHRPGFHLPTSDIMSFGANLTGFSFANFFARNLANVLIGRFVGVTPLGYYQLGGVDALVAPPVGSGG